MDMRIRNLHFAVVWTAALLTAGSSLARADLIYDNGLPGGFLGYWGPDVCTDQSVGVRFTSTNDYAFDEVSLWLMNNDWSGSTHPVVRVTLRPDWQQDGQSRPDPAVIEEMFVTVSTIGWLPILETAHSTDHPRLCAGRHYWIVAESAAPCGLDGVWVVSGEDTGFSANTNNGEWQAGGDGAVPGMQVRATPLALGDMDGSGICDLEDVTPFVLALIDQPLTPDHVARADMNCDGAADGRDVQLFVDALIAN
ncbi:MAG: hypothetical protein KF841_00235 [Phycisphaerae bacterium]|nr:hypothetical protein [Phycisphaerae bacterium]